jgi:tetratricopeptide (TPR) repeat protein
LTNQHTTYEIFISYSRVDNRPQLQDQSASEGWVSALRDRIQADHRRFSTEPLHIFFDREDIQDMDDWRHRILGALRTSRILLVCYSPAYLASEHCRWEWEEYHRRQARTVAGHEGVATVYFVQVPTAVSGDLTAWIRDVERSGFTDLREWFAEGMIALQKEVVQRRLRALGQSLWERIQRSRRAMEVHGNLRRPTPFFVGRSKELHRLHEQVGLGAVGAITVIHGLGGLGKTELLVTYAHAWADCYPGGTWIMNAEGAPALLPLIGNLAFAPEFSYTPTETEKSDPSLLGRRVLVELERRIRKQREEDPDGAAAVMILLDNVTVPSLFSSAELATLPETDWLRVAGTSRYGPERFRESRRLTLIPLNPLTEEDAFGLLREHQPDQRFSSEAAEQAARQIAGMLGGFTLAIEQVAVYLGLHPDVTPERLLDALVARGLTYTDSVQEMLVAEGREGEILHREKRLSLVLQTILAPLRDLERTVLRLAAELPPDAVAWPWVEFLAAAKHPLAIDSPPEEPNPMKAVRRRLEGARLLTPGPGPELLRIHRLVAAHIASADPAPELLRDLCSFLGSQARGLFESHEPPENWVLDALAATLSHLLETQRGQPDCLFEVGVAAVRFAGRVVAYRGFGVADAMTDVAHGALQGLVDREPSNLDWQFGLSWSLEWKSLRAARRADLQTALRLMEQCHEIRVRLGESAANREWTKGLGVSWGALGNLQMTLGDLDRAEWCYRESVRVHRKILADYGENLADSRDLTSALEKLGDLLLSQGRIDECGALYEESHAIRVGLTNLDAGEFGWQQDLAISMEKLGDLARARGLFEKAIHDYQRSAAIRERLLAADPGNLQSRATLSASLNKLGHVALYDLRDQHRARVFLTKDLEIAESLASSDPDDPLLARWLAITYAALADLESAVDDDEKRDERLRQCLGVFHRMEARGLALGYTEDLRAQIRRHFSSEE